MNRAPVALLTAAAALSLALGACGSGGGKAKAAPVASSTTTATTAATTPPTSTAAAPTQSSCHPVKAQGRLNRHAKKPTSALSRGKRYVVTLRTSCGEIQITLDAKAHPKTAASFAALVQGGFYDGLGVVRVVPGFVLQAGDPNGDGSGGPGYSVVEPPGSNAAYRKGVIAMAKTSAEAPGTSGSQFFIVTGADAGLPPEYAIAGRVTKGQAVADVIGAVPPQGGQDGPPTMPVLIEHATLSAK